MRLETRSVLLAGGVLAFLLASLSIADMFVRRPYDGVVLEADVPGLLVVRQVVAGSGAARAGVAPGDQIVGIDRNALRSVAHAAEILNRRQIGDEVPYFLRSAEGELRETWVELGPRRMGSLPYLMACVLGFAFFFVGAGVLNRQPRLRAAQVFFGLCVLFFLFLVCRLRPASYTWVDSFVLTTGTAALLFLPACFLHFFLIFPRPVRLRPEPGDPRYRRRRRTWVTLVGAIYLLPPLVLVLRLALARWEGEPLSLISGAPVESWWTLAVYIATGLGVLAWQARRLDNPRERSGVALVFFGALFGLLPFLFTAVLYPNVFHTDHFLIYGVAPLALVPVTFAYAIVRFQLLDIRVILRKSLLYTVTTASVTAVYALGIALLTRLSSATELTASPLFPVFFALVILLLFEPVRRRIQVLVDRWFLAERTSLEIEIQEIRDTLMAHRDVQQALEELVGRLPRLLGLHFAGLYRRRDGLVRAAGPVILPAFVPCDERLDAELERRGGLASVEQLRRTLGRRAAKVLKPIAESGIELIGDLSTPRRKIGWLVLSGKTGQFSFDTAEMELLESLLRQSALALETSLLLEERTRQAEYERELEIAASVQSELLPGSLSLGPGWTVAAVCR
ncbi:MAG: PDZ domain-containing protein, partial [Thermoanaerobaculia bacterium]|nr:PDZ domain-containing protein [Thermoanaerobaculia bacterium]